MRQPVEVDAFGHEGRRDAFQCVEKLRMPLGEERHVGPHICASGLRHDLTCGEPNSIVTSIMLSSPREQGLRVWGSAGSRTEVRSAMPPRAVHPGEAPSGLRR